MDTATLQSYKHPWRAKRRSRWDNSPAGVRRRLAKQDARREAIAAALPPIAPDPTPGELWQEMVVRLYVPRGPARCDQHAVEINGRRIGLLSASDIGREVAAEAHKRPSLALQADSRREQLIGAERSFLP